MASIQLDDVSKVYPDGFTAIHHLDMEIADGEFRVVLGPSGCGKSTVLRMIAGLEAVSTGTIHVGGDDIADVRPSDRDVAMAFQQHALYPHMTVAENIGFPLKVAGERVTEITEHVRVIAEALDLLDVLERRPRTISGGQQQRVSLARAMIRHPSLFLLDEPLSNLDAHLRLDARQRIRDAHRLLDLTVVFVTHDQGEAMSLADRITVMRGGRIVQTGTPRELYEHPTDVFVARFLGSPQMNIVVATPRHHDGGYVVHIGSHEMDVAVTSENDRSRWDRVVDRPVALGIRPESLRRVDPAAGVVTSVESTELLGHEQLVHAVIDSPSVDLTASGVEVGRDRYSEFAALVDARADVNRFEPFAVRPDPGSLHLFDLETGAAIVS